MSSVGEGLSMKGKPINKDKKNENKKKGKPQQKTSSGNVPNIRCYNCKKECHTRKVCPERQKSNGDSNKDGNVAIAQEGYESGDALVASCTNSDTEHMTPNKYLFEELCKQDSGTVLIGKNNACKIAGIGSIRFKLQDG